MSSPSSAPVSLRRSLRVVNNVPNRNAFSPWINSGALGIDDEVEEKKSESEGEGVGEDPASADDNDDPHSSADDNDDPHSSADDNDDPASADDNDDPPLAFTQRSTEPFFLKKLLNDRVLMPVYRPPVHNKVVPARVGESQAMTDFRQHGLAVNEKEWDICIHFLAQATRWRYHLSGAEKSTALKELKCQWGPRLTTSDRKGVFYKEVMCSYHVIYFDPDLTKQWKPLRLDLPELNTLARSVKVNMLAEECFLLRRLLQFILDTRRRDTVWWNGPSRAWDKKLKSLCDRITKETTVGFISNKKKRHCVEVKDGHLLLYVHHWTNATEKNKVIDVMKDSIDTRLPHSFETLEAHPWWKTRVDLFVKKELSPSTIHTITEQTSGELLVTILVDDVLRHFPCDSRPSLKKVAETRELTSWVEWLTKEAADAISSSADSSAAPLSPHDSSAAPRSPHDSPTDPVSNNNDSGSDNTGVDPIPLTPERKETEGQVREKEAALDKLQKAKDKLQKANEELQKANEELQKKLERAEAQNLVPPSLGRQRAAAEREALGRKWVAELLKGPLAKRDREFKLLGLPLPPKKKTRTAAGGPEEEKETQPPSPAPPSDSGQEENEEGDDLSNDLSSVLGNILAHLDDDRSAKFYYNKRNEDGTAPMNLNMMKSKCKNKQYTRRKEFLDDMDESVTEEAGYQSLSGKTLLGKMSTQIDEHRELLDNAENQGDKSG